MQNNIKTETRLAFIQFIFSSFFSEISIEENCNDFEKYFNKLSVSSIEQKEELLINFNKSYFNKLVSSYNNFITHYNIEHIVNPLLSFDRKFESWDRVNKSIILSIFSEIEITKKLKIKILLNDYLNISKLLISKKELGMINAIADKYINEKNII